MYNFHPNKQGQRHAHGLLLLDQGYCFEEVAQILLRCQKSVYNWVNRWLDQGLVGLYDQMRRGRKPLLDLAACLKVEAIIEQAPRRVSQHLEEIQRQTGHLISKSTLKRTLRSMGLRWKRIRKWLGSLHNEEDFRMAQQELESLKELEDKGLIELYFCDESGFNLTPCLPYAWQKKGQTICLPAAKAGSYNVLGIMGGNNTLYAYGFQGSINSQVAIACMDEFAVQGEQKAACLPAYVIIDNAPIHNSQAFRAKENQWVKQGITIKRIPAYCPELNLIEILWRKIKYDWIPFDAYQTLDKLIHEVEQVIRDVGKRFVINSAGLLTCSRTARPGRIK